MVVIVIVYWRNKLENNNNNNNKFVENVWNFNLFFRCCCCFFKRMIHIDRFFLWFLDRNQIQWRKQKLTNTKKITFDELMCGFIYFHRSTCIVMWKKCLIDLIPNDVFSHWMMLMMCFFNINDMWNSHFFVVFFCFSHSSLPTSVINIFNFWISFI